MTATRSTLLIPVESQVRELDAKLLLSCVAAERGFPVVLGSRAFLHLEVASMPRGIYLAKSMRSLSDRMFDILRKLGHEIIAFDEEGLVRFSDEQYYRRRLSEKALNRVSALFAWGEDDARAFRDFSGYRGTPIHVTGNPRIDLMRPEVRSYFDEEVDAIRERFGDFILVNTNFATVNAFLPGMNVFKQDREKKGRTRIGAAGVGFSPQWARGLAEFKTAVFEHFKRMIPALAELHPTHHVVIRPHPGERHGPWEEVAKDYPNVHVANGSSVIPWLLASKVLVHNGCTTAVEAAVLGTPAVAYRPVRSGDYDLHLPNGLSHQCDDLDALREKVRSVLSGRTATREDEQKRHLMSRHLASLTGPLAADRMIGVLQEMGYPERIPSRPPPVAHAIGWLHAQGRRQVKRFNRKRTGHRNNAAFHAHRFPGVSLEDIEERIGRFSRHLGRFEKLRARQISQHIFRIDQ